MEQELSEKSELRCLWAGFFNLLNSRQSYPSPFKLISSRRAMKTSFRANSRLDEECRKSQKKEANLTSSTGEKSVRSLIQDDMYIDSHKNKKFPVKRPKLLKTGSKLIDRPVKSQKVGKKTSHLRAHQSTPNAKSSIYNRPSTEVDDKILQQARMSVKTFIDQMFVDGKLVHEEPTTIEPLPFSDALHVLSTNKKDLFVGFSKESDSDCSVRPSPKKSSEKPVIFSVKEIKHKLKHLRKEVPRKRSDLGNDCKFSHNEKVGKKIELKELENTRKKIDFSISSFSNREDCLLAREIKQRQLSEKLRSLRTTSKAASRGSPEAIRMILSSAEHEFFPRRDNQCSCSDGTNIRIQDNFPSTNRRRICVSPLGTTGTEVVITSCNECKEFYDTFSSGTNSFQTRSTDEDSSQDSSNFDIANMRSNGEPHMVETENISHSDGTVMTHSASDSLSETFTSTTDDLPSTPTSSQDLNTPQSMKNHDEQESPVSVLEKLIFIEQANSPSNMLRNGRKRSHPRNLYFERFSIETYLQDQPIAENVCVDEKDYISKYVHWVLQSSFLSWEQLSEISPQPQRLLHPSLFDEIEFLTSDNRINHRLLFDHVNEILLEIHRSHFSFFPRPDFLKPMKCVLPLEELVCDEIMREPANYSLLVSTQGRTVDQLVSDDVSDSRSWIDARTEAEYITIHISEDILEECVLEILLGSHSSSFCVDFEASEYDSDRKQIEEFLAD